MVEQSLVLLVLLVLPIHVSSGTQGGTHLRSQRKLATNSEPLPLVAVASGGGMTLYLNKNTYYAGERINGEVSIQPTSNAVLSNVEVKVTGTSWAILQERTISVAMSPQYPHSYPPECISEAGPQMAQVAYTPHSTVNIEAANITSILTNGTEPMPLSAGKEYRLGFSLALPHDMAASADLPHGGISYTLSAMVSMAGPYPTQNPIDYELIVQPRAREAKELTPMNLRLVEKIVRNSVVEVMADSLVRLGIGHAQTGMLELQVQANSGVINMDWGQHSDFEGNINIINRSNQTLNSLSMELKTCMTSTAMGQVETDCYITYSKDLLQTEVQGGEVLTGVPFKARPSTIYHDSQSPNNKVANSVELHAVLSGHDQVNFAVPLIVAPILSAAR